MDQASRPNRRLRLQRRLRGWSQEDVAAGLYRVASAAGEADLGVDATMISRWERGTRHPRPRYVRLLCQLFDLPADNLGLLGAPDPPSPAPGRAAAVPAVRPARRAARPGEGPGAVARAAPARGPDGGRR